MACGAASVYGEVFMASGHNATTYTELHKELNQASQSDTTLCFAHSKAGIADIAADSAHCTQGVVIYGGVPSIYQLQNIKSPVLVLGGSRDGVSPISQVVELNRNTLSITTQFCFQSDLFLIYGCIFYVCVHSSQCLDIIPSTMPLTH